MKKTITAKRKDGTPVREGDRVLAVWDNGKKYFGKIDTLKPPMQFNSLRGLQLQTYLISCSDGMLRPAHAWHIKIVLQKRRKK